MANNLGLDPFPDPVGHFGAPWQPFWILQVFYVSHRRSAWIKNPILRKLFRAPNNLGLDPFPDPVGPFGAILDFAGGSMFLIEGVLRSKNLFSEICSHRPII